MRLRALGTIFVLCILLAGCNSASNDGLNGVKDLALTPVSIKTFRFTWTDVGPGPTEYRLLEDPDGLSGYTEVASIAPGIGGYDLDVFLPGRINARYVLQACNEDNCVDSAPVNVAGTLGEAVGYVKASNTGALDYFGYSVALSAAGSTLAVGAYMEASAATGINGDETDDSAGAGGAVYVFTRSGSSWNQQAYIKASNAGADDMLGDWFGRSIALSADGNTLVVTAPFESSNALGINGEEDDNSAPQSGAAYVFTRDDNTWSQQAYIKASSSSAHWFGWSVALAADGNTLAVGDSSTIGTVYVFTRSDNVWSQQAHINASNTYTGSYDVGLLQALNFGDSVALAADGNTLAVGGPGDDSDATGINGDGANHLAIDSGAAYIFIRNDNVWSQQAYIKASNTGAGDSFGTGVALSADGNTLAVGATGEDSNATGINGDQGNDLAPDSGAAYIFIRDHDTWSQQAYLKASNIGTDILTPAYIAYGKGVDLSAYGTNVDLSADGNTLIVSAHDESGNASGINGNVTGDVFLQSGAVYMYSRRGDTWSQRAYIKAPAPMSGNWFGRGIDLAADGNTLAVGAYGEDGAATGINGDQDQINNWIGDSGAVYLY